MLSSLKSYFHFDNYCGGSSSKLYITVEVKFLPRFVTILVAASQHLTPSLQLKQIQIWFIISEKYINKFETNTFKNLRQIHSEINLWPYWLPPANNWLYHCSSSMSSFFLCPAFTYFQLTLMSNLHLYWYTHVQLILMSSLYLFTTYTYVQFTLILL